MSKMYIFATIASLLISCSVKRSESINLMKAEKNEVVQDCPEEGSCSIEYLANKSLKVNKDTTDKLYYSLEDDLQKSVLRFQFKKDNPSAMTEANYIEEIVFEIQNSVEEFNLADDFLESAKVLFGKHCYCKGQAGIYLVQSGSLKVRQDKENVAVQLKFNALPITHEVSNIEYTIKK